MTTFKSRWPIGATVYLLGRAERLPGVITEVTFSQTGRVYSVRWGDGTSDTHYELELVEEFDPAYAE